MSAIDDTLMRQAQPRPADRIAQLEARILALEAELTAARGQPEASAVVPPEHWQVFAGIIADVSGPTGEDYCYESATADTEAFFGCPLAGVRATALGLDPGQIAAVVALIRDCVRTGRASAREHDFVAPRRPTGWYFGTIVPLPPSATHAARAFFTVTDISWRRRAEQAVADSEARFRSLADSAPVPIWECDAAGRVTWLNRPWLDHTGRSLEQEIGDGWQDGVHPDDLAACLGVYYDALARRIPYRMTYRLRRADGSWRTMNESGAPRNGPDGTFVGLVGSAVDETEARAAQAALTVSEETLRLAVESAELGLWDMNLQSGELHWSARCKAMFGLAPDHPVTPADFVTFLHPDDRDGVAASFARATDPATRSGHDVEYRVIGAQDGVERWVAAKGRAMFDAAGRCVRAIGTAIDITARKQAEAALRHGTVELEARVAERTAQLAESETRLRAYFESVEDCLFTVLCDPDGRFIHEGYNPYGERRTGYGNAVTRGRSAAEFMAPDTARAIETLLAAARDRGTQRVTMNLAFPAGPGVFDILMVPVRDAGGRVARILGAWREVTEQMRMEEELRQTQKMQAIGQLTGGVAHDFNNLLTAIIGNLDLLAQETMSGRGRRLLEAALRSAGRGATLTAQLLAFARRQRLEPRPLDLNALVVGMAGLLQSTLGGSVQVHTALAPDLWPALADATQLELAILNVAINARDAMPQGGTIVITTANARIGEPQAAEDPPSGAHVVVTISDAGEGMTAEVLARVFEPFFTTKEVGRGSGLGLPQVLGVAKQLGGGVRVASRPGSGTQVQIYLPCAGAERPALLTGHPAAPAPGGLRGARILVVDDDAEVREVAAGLLAELGATVLTAPGGAAALALIADGAAVDAALVDYAMPGMSGSQTLARLRVLRPALPVVIVSGYADTEALSGGDAQLLRKPFRAIDLAAALGPLLRG